jgi:hypothetical protein
MTEPGASALLGGTVAYTLQHFGVDLHTMVVALVGAAAFQAWSSATVSRRRALAQVLSGGVIGAFGAHWAMELVGIASRPGLMLTAAFLGWAYAHIFQGGTKSAGTVIDNLATKLGGRND